MPKNLVFALYVTALGILAGCGSQRHESGPPQTEQVAIELGKTDRATVDLNMRAGEMIVRSGADKLIEGDLEYNPPIWKPKVDSSVIGSHTSVTITQPEHDVFIGNHHSRWDLSLNDKVLLDLQTRCGAGKTRLELGDLKLRNVDVRMGAGQVDVDLRGKPVQDYDVHVSGGVGQARIWLPQGVGIRADAHGGIGSIKVTGLDKEGDHYQNRMYDISPINIRLTVEGGVGQIQIIG